MNDKEEKEVGVGVIAIVAVMLLAGASPVLYVLAKGWWAMWTDILSGRL